MLQRKRKQKTKDGQEIKNQDHFRCAITCRYCGKRRHYEDECRDSEKLKKAEEERRKNASKGGRPEGGGPTLEVRVRVTLVEDEGPQPPPLVEEEHPTPHLRVSRQVKNALPPPPQALMAPIRAARTPRSAASTGTLTACRSLAWK